MLREGFEISPGTSSVQDEIKEVEQELEEKDFTSPVSPIAASAIHPAEALEAGVSWKPRRQDNNVFAQRVSGGVVNLLNLLFSPVFVQTFIMTFLGEWGDRSQIATITLAAAEGISPPFLGVWAN
jgi:Ca2+/H+ antiporter, TMEM165/GDT1 family